MKYIILGTAGHIDHGKSTLVKALTGTDPDRLKEEKERGITLDLGFASLDLPGGNRLGIVDVPGHEGLIKNMLAGVGGMDIVMLVIAADEGIMPQTREHLAICDLLQVKKGLIVLTKMDMVDKDWLALVQDEVREFVKGTFLEKSPLVPVSSKTGENLPLLVQELASSRTRSTPEIIERHPAPAHRPRLHHERLRHGHHRHPAFGHDQHGSGSRDPAQGDQNKGPRHPVP